MDKLFRNAKQRKNADKKFVTIHQCFLICVSEKFLSVPRIVLKKINLLLCNIFLVHPVFRNSRNARKIQSEDFFLENVSFQVQKSKSALLFKGVINFEKVTETKTLRTIDVHSKKTCSKALVKHKSSDKILVKYAVYYFHKAHTQPDSRVHI